VEGSSRIFVMESPEVYLMTSVHIKETIFMKY